MQVIAPDLAEALGSADGLLGAALADPDLRLLDDHQLLALARLADRVAARVDAVQRLVVGDIDARDATRRVHGVTLAAWLRDDASRTAKQAHSEIGEARRSRTAPQVWRALADAQLSPHQATAITRSLRHLPADLASDKQAEAERAMVAYAREFDPHELRTLGNRLVEVIDPDHADEVIGERLERQDRSARLARELHLVPDGCGSMLIRGQLPLADGEQLATMIDAIADQKLVGVLEDAPLCGPSCPGATCGLCGGRPSRSMLRADALVALAGAYADAGRAPVVGNDRPRVHVTIDLEALRTGLGVTELAGEPLSAQGARLLACDSTVIPLVLDGRGVPLDVGREKRFFDRELRAAIETRDGGCAFPGCDRPPRVCAAHHIVPWWWNGPTSLDNGVLLCRHHHALVEPSRQRLHDPHRWEVRIAADGLPEFLPPRGLDPGRRPRRHLRHRLRAGLPGGDEPE